MVLLSAIQKSNALLSTSTTIPERLVAVFPGGTSGIGECAVKGLARLARKPTIYLIGRSQPSADRIIAECKEINKDGEYIFLKTDVSLMRNVDKTCEEIRKREKYVNLLVLSVGVLMGKNLTEEGVSVAMAIIYYARLRFIEGLLPLLQAAPGLRRVVSVFAAGHEGALDPAEIRTGPINTMNLTKIRAHMVSQMTLAHELFAARAPDVAFIQNFPGSVKGNLASSLKGQGLGLEIMAVSVTVIYSLIGRFVFMKPDEVGDRHVFLMTAGKFPPGESAVGEGLPLPEDMEVAKGSDGVPGSGAYTILVDGESSGPHALEVLEGLRKDGTKEAIRKDLEDFWAKVDSLKASV